MRADLHPRREGAVLLCRLGDTGEADAHILAAPYFDRGGGSDRRRHRSGGPDADVGDPACHGAGPIRPGLGRSVARVSRLSASPGASPPGPDGLVCRRCGVRPRRAARLRRRHVFHGGLVPHVHPGGTVAGETARTVWVPGVPGAILGNPMTEGEQPGPMVRSTGDEMFRIGELSAKTGCKIETITRRTDRQRSARLHHGTPQAAGHTCGEVREAAESHLKEVRERITDLRTIQRVLSGMVRSCQGGTVPVPSDRSALYRRSCRPANSVTEVR